MSPHTPLQVYINSLMADIDRTQAVMDELKSDADSAVNNARKSSDEFEELLRQLKSIGASKDQDA